MNSPKKLVKNFLNAHWLRFENLPWDIQVALFFQKYKPNKIGRSLEVGVGNGINTLLNLGGSLKNNEAMEPTNEASIGALNQQLLLTPYT